jgi:hypothetical protein
MLQPLQQAVEVGDLFRLPAIVLKKMIYLTKPFLVKYWQLRYLVTSHYLCSCFIF